MKFLILFLVAVLISSIGFKKFVWFISLGYGFSIAGIGVALLIMFAKNLTPVTAIMAVMLIIYGCRLGGYLLIREKKSASYQKTMKNDIKDGSDMKLFPMLCVWLSCALLYVLEASPVFFRLKSGAKDNGCAIAGMIIMILGIVLESAADLTKNSFKKKNPKRFCDVGLFKIVRCPSFRELQLTKTHLNGYVQLPAGFALFILCSAVQEGLKSGKIRITEVTQNIRNM